MKPSELRNVTIFLATVLNSPMANATTNLPWENFIPALIIIPIVLLILAFSSKK